ncbi:R3H domain-containing nucleic acid-binding protein [Saxibacter everestensis]|uniref:R3H domain-containing nucleic acid-binding protein n=1 Tax=Saxibacter everestensis TaxID=2909229 RepID=A0ABY8QTQ8_9MICO|nr:R3H domain-containing nucleic acid-binding protein [Brevibacteriaceae bacterium ZFBP1038]
MTDSALAEPGKPSAAELEPDVEPDAVDGETTAATLEEEGEIAADYLEELLDIADIDGDIDIDVVGGRAQVAIVSEEQNSDLSRLVGRSGEVVDALQELTRLTVQTTTGERSRLMLDVAGFRQEQKTQLETIANKAIADVQAGAESVACRPMNAFERKVVHDAVADAGLRSESDGQGDNRHVVVYPA